MLLSRKLILAALLLILVMSLAAYGEAAESASNERISITAGDMILQGTLLDNETSREFAKLLPMTVPIYEPADFAKAFSLPQRFSEPLERTREYEIGGIAYWHEGPSVAIFFSDHVAQTVVPVVRIGKIFEGAEKLKDYEGEIIIQRVL